MAIKDDTQTTAQQTYTGQSEATQQNNNQGFSWGMLGFAGVGGLSRQATSAALTKTTEALTEVYKGLGIQKPFEVILVPIDNAKETNLHLSSIAVCVRTGPKSPVAYHIVMLEGSGEALQPKIENINNRQIQIDRLTSDVFDNDYQATAEQVVKRAFPGAELRPCSGQYVPRTFNLEDKEALRNLAVNTVMPALADLSTGFQGFVDMDLTKYNRDSQLNINIGFGETDKIDYAGLPVRNNASIRLIASSNQKANPHAINTSEKSVCVSELGGFIDLVWSPVEAVANPYQPVVGPQQKFAARFVMTNLENQLAMTIPSQLLALASSLALREGTNWYPYYAPRAVGVAGKAVDLRDIGAINIEANVMNEPGQYGTRIDTKAASFTDLELGKLIAATIRPGMIYSLDVSECGADTWYNEVFLAAAAGNSNATAALIDAANTLTGGHFSKYFSANQNAGVVLQNDDRIQLGYYTNSDGQKRDIREIDHLAVLNLVGDKDPKAGEDWSQTYLNFNYPVVQRLDARRKMIVDLVRGDVVFTGFARRITFTNVFLDALIAGCKDAGLDVRTHSSAFGHNYQSQRSGFSAINQASMAPGATGVFNQGFSTAPGMNSNYGYQNRGFRNW